MCFRKINYFWLLRSSSIRLNFDQTSTKLRQVVARSFDQTSTKLLPNLDTPSVEVWSKFGRCISEAHRKPDNTDQTATPNFDQTSTKLRPNFYPTYTKLRPNFDPTSTKLRPNFGTHIVLNRLFHTSN